MKIELKNITFSERLSEETNAFAATLYIDGKKACEVSNDGRGGCDRYTDWKVAERINAYAATLPKRKCWGVELEMNADMLVGDLFESWLEERAVKKLLSKAMVFETLDGKFAATKNVTADMRARTLQSPERALVALKGKRFITDLVEARKLYRETFKPKHEQAVEPA